VNANGQLKSLWYVGAMLTGVLTTMIIMKQGYQAGFLKIKEGLDWTYGGTVHS